ncbi:hypothetical protein AJ80_04585 [Polytolypa hystricis UAMH7299]|uniref:Uncharacterized protein n=1 Tax=Polytolypa hystricis (strain UAMH7299) TaxID=1447883 RepID=A0A2B7YBA2_POLH7|nr:hypothetical protein AJ80_04585 [Polytolypa hystricis UAMH7299]
MMKSLTDISYSVDGWSQSKNPENLPEEFIERLKNHACHPSQPVDGDAVAALLHKFVNNDQEQHRLPPRSFQSSGTKGGLDPNQDQRSEAGSDATELIDEEEQYRANVRRATEDYHKLVEDGGRPSHPLSLLEDIGKDPSDYSEILSFWTGLHGEPHYKAFTAQLWRWESFRQLQRYARGLHVNEWEEHRERVIKHHDREYFESLAFVFGQKRLWEHFIWRHRRIEKEQGRFAAYTAAAKDRLARHGFTREFHLDEDPACQVKLTTWIEYLAYEYWWYTRYSLSKQFILIDRNLYALEDAEKDAQKAVEAAKYAVTFAEAASSDAQRLDCSLKKEAEKRLAEAQSKLESTTEECNRTQRRKKLRYEYMSKTSDLRHMNKDAELHNKLIRWMLEQIPLIELEMKQDSSKDSSDGTARAGETDLGGCKQTKDQGAAGQDDSRKDNMDSSLRKRRSPSHQESRKSKRSHESIDGERPSKRAKQSDQVQNASSPQISASETAESAMAKSRRPKERRTKLKKELVG